MCSIVSGTLPAKFNFDGVSFLSTMISQQTVMQFFWRGIWASSLVLLSQAIRVMRSQPAGGHIFNMDGAGADGGATPRFAAYGASKRGLAQLGKSLQV